MNVESKTAIARPGTRSLRATVPGGIVAFLNLQDGDTLDWKIETSKDDQYVIVCKAKPSRGK